MAWVQEREERISAFGEEGLCVGGKPEKEKNDSRRSSDIF